VNQPGGDENPARVMKMTKENSRLLREVKIEAKNDEDGS